MKIVKWLMIALIASAIVCVGCSQEDRDEIVERGGNAISALKGETTPGEKTPRIVKEQQRKERIRQNNTVRITLLSTVNHYWRRFNGRHAILRLGYMRPPVLLRL